MTHLAVPEFFSWQDAISPPILDVRSPGEFAKGHIPGAVNLPLFEDSERAEIGTLYKRQGPDLALERGLEIVGPKMASLLRKGKALATQGQVRIHCWRGGMRSQSVAQLLKAGGLNVATLQGGYKAYRNWTRQALTKPLQLVILGGKSGSGKTELLHGLAQAGEQILDLEGLAQHKGSVFGGLGQEAQPSSEHFSNLLHQKLTELDRTRRIWVEDESLMIGRVCIPEPFWQQMKEAPTMVIEASLDSRVKRLLADYGHCAPEKVTAAFLRIKKRLGGQNLKEALAAVEEGAPEKAARIALRYYDKAYSYGLEQRPSSKVVYLDLTHLALQASVAKLLQSVETIPDSSKPQTS